MKYHKLGSLKKQRFFHSYGDQKSEINFTEPRSRCCWQGCALFAGSRKGSFLAFYYAGDAGVPWLPAVSLQPLLCDHIAFSPSVYDLSLPPSYKDVCAYIYGPPYNAGKSPHLQFLSLMTPEYVLLK